MARDISGIVKVNGVVQAGCKVRCYLAAKLGEATSFYVGKHIFETTTDAAGVYEFRNLAAQGAPGAENDTYAIVVLPPADQVPDGAGNKFHALIKDKVVVSNT